MSCWLATQVLSRKKSSSSMRGRCPGWLYMSSFQQASWLSRLCHSCISASECHECYSMSIDISLTVLRLCKCPRNCFGKNKNTQEMQDK